MYSLDTSMFMYWQARYYPVDVFDTLRLQAAAIRSSLSISSLDH
jgi:hypothetical protein